MIAVKEAGTEDKGRIAKEQPEAPVSYTHLDVYKRQHQKRSVG